MRRVHIFLALAAMAFAPQAAVAANSIHRSASPPTPPVAQAPPPAPVAPYDGQLLKLSELMGSVAFLADLCPDIHDSAQNGEVWRLKAQNLLEAEAPESNLKMLLAGAYNRGYLGFEVNYRVCTDIARMSFARNISAIGVIAGELTRKYSGN